MSISYKKKKKKIGSCPMINHKQLNFLLIGWLYILVCLGQFLVMPVAPAKFINNAPFHSQKCLDIDNNVYVCLNYRFTYSSYKLILTTMKLGRLVGDERKLGEVRCCCEHSENSPATQMSQSPIYQKILVTEILTY